MSFFAFTPSRRAATALLLVFASAPSAADAQSACAPAAPGNGERILCSGEGSGIRARNLDDAVFEIDETARIDGVDGQAFEFNERVVFSNAGRLIGRDDHAVQGRDFSTVINTGTLITYGDGDGINIDHRSSATNHGRIEAADDGIQVEEDSVVVNHGVILSTDKGIQGARGTRVTNHGEIVAGSEGVEVNEADAVVFNHGSIRSEDDAVNVGENAHVVNTGTILVTGPQDGIDLDSGLVENSGTIRALGGEDGIDFDPSPNASRVVNTGLIEGAHAIYADPLDEGAQTVENSGILRGLSGVAVDLGRGDDRLILLEGSRVEGAIEMGEGHDVVEIREARPMTLEFGSAPEEVIAPLPTIFGQGRLALIDPAPLSAADRMAGSLAFGLARGSLGRRGAGGWVGGFVERDEAETSGGLALDGRRTGAMLGYDAQARDGLFWGGWLALSRATADLGDDLHKIDQNAAAFGLSGGWAPDAATRIGATAFLGFTRTELESAAPLTGSGEADGLLYGVALRGERRLLAPAQGRPGLDLSAEAGWARHDMEEYAVSGLGGARIDDRAADALWARAEIGAPILWSAVEFRPFLSASVLNVDSDSIAYAALGAATDFAAADWEQDARFGGGLSLRVPVGAGSLNTRLTAESGDFAFNLRFDLPFGR